MNNTSANVRGFAYIDPHVDVTATQVFQDAGLVKVREVGRMAGLELGVRVLM